MRWINKIADDGQGISHPDPLHTLGSTEPTAALGFVTFAKAYLRLRNDRRPFFPSLAGMSKKARLDSDVFGSIDLFRAVPERALHKIADPARIRRLPRRTHIFSQGDEEVRAHAVIEGAVQIVQSGSDGAQVVMRIAGPRQMFGTVAMFTGCRYAADAVTMSETVEASWSEADFMALVAAYPQIAFNLIRIVGERLQEMQERVRELATHSAERRIAQAVLRLARQTGRSTSAGIAIGVPLRRKDIADIAGTTLHTASRLLAAWEKAGILVNNKRILTVRRMPELRAIAQT